MFDKIQDLYWQIVPYDWRLRQIVYRLRCFFWCRYTTVKPRTLPYHTWTDRDNLLAHCSFEILSRFIENECSPGNVDWYSDDCPHKIVVNGVEKWVRDEMQEIYEWWHNKYIKGQNDENERLHKEIEKVEPITYTGEKDGQWYWEPQFKCEEDAVEWKGYMRALSDLERNIESELQLMLHRLVDIRQYMWT